MLNWEWTFADDYEDCGDWINARNYMYKEWCSDKYNIKKLLRLSFLCWAITVDNDYLIDSNKVNKEIFKDTLDETFSFGLKFFRNNVNFLCMYGYMISIKPSLFGNELLFQKVGNQWKYEAYQKSPQDSIIKCLFLEGVDFEVRKKLGYKQLCRELIPNIENTFKGNGYMQKYFKSLLLVDLLSNN